MKKVAITMLVIVCVFMCLPNITTSAADKYIIKSHGTLVYNNEEGQEVLLTAEDLEYLDKQIEVLPDAFYNKGKQDALAQFTGSTFKGGGWTGKGGAYTFPQSFDFVYVALADDNSNDEIPRQWPLRMNVSCRADLIHNYYARYGGHAYICTIYKVYNVPAGACVYAHDGVEDNSCDIKVFR